MREIKFRAWDRGEGKMVYLTQENGAHLHIGYSGLAWTITNSDRHLFVAYDEGVLMQYTGLKDKSGKEIYEGDIVSIPIDGVGVVVYEKPDNSNQYLYFVKGDRWVQGIDDVKVIGNIYENPELLKEGNDVE